MTDEEIAQLRARAAELDELLDCHEDPEQSFEDQCDLLDKLCRTRAARRAPDPRSTGPEGKNG